MVFTLYFLTGLLKISNALKYMRNHLLWSEKNCVELK